MKAPLLATSEAVAAAPRQARSVAKREKLLAAGRALFAEKGYDATSIEDITSAAGAAAGAFYSHFRSKRQLLVALMNELMQRLSAVDLRPGGGVNGRAGLRRFLNKVFEADLEYFGVIRAWQEAVLTDPELGEMQQSIARWTEARILRVLQALAKAPNARGDYDLVTFARMMDRHFWSLLARGARISPREFAREVATASDVIYRYMLTERRRPRRLAGRRPAAPRAGGETPPSQPAGRRRS